MAADWTTNSDAVMRGMFGNLLSGAANGRDAANMWQSLREGAYSWAENYLTLTGTTKPTEEQIQAKGQDLIGHVTIMDMNRYVKLAGEAISAKNALHAMQPGTQIEGNAIWRPPWATSGGTDGRFEKYRIEIQRSITYRGINVTTTKWSSYEITSPLTTVEDALAQADSLFQQAKYFRSVGNYSTLDYRITKI